MVQVAKVGKRTLPPQGVSPMAELSLRLAVNPKQAKWLRVNQEQQAQLARVNPQSLQKKSVTMSWAGHRVVLVAQVVQVVLVVLVVQAHQAHPVALAGLRAQVV